jgi:hypothetical protein
MSAASTVAALSNGESLCRTFDVDDPAVKAWNVRQRMLSEIERKGSYFDANTTAPEINRLLDTAEESFRFVQAVTLQGVLAKLWVALSHLGGVCRRNDDHLEHDAVRRADTNEVSTFIREWDFGEEVLFGAIVDIERALQFERVSFDGDSLVPFEEGRMAPPGSSTGG